LDRSLGLGTGSCGPAGGVGPAVCGGAVSSASATRTGAASWHHRRPKTCDEGILPPNSSRALISGAVTFTTALGTSICQGKIHVFRAFGKLTF